MPPMVDPKCYRNHFLMSGWDRWVCNILCIYIYIYGTIWYRMYMHLHIFPIQSYTYTIYIYIYILYTYIYTYIYIYIHTYIYILCVYIYIYIHRVMPHLLRTPKNALVVGVPGRLHGGALRLRWNEAMDAGKRPGRSFFLGENDPMKRPNFIGLRRKKSPRHKSIIGFNVMIPMGIVRFLVELLRS